MTKLCFVIFLVLASTLVVADCQFSNGTKLVTIKAGQSVSLRDPGKSLEDLTIQDQDGLGTCYANTTSTVLKSILPNHPDISYTHAAIMSKTHGWRKRWVQSKQKYVTKDKDFTSSGWVCETIDGLKKSGGACPKNFSVTESTQLWSSYTQKRLLAGLGSYFDMMNLNKNDPVALTQLKSSLEMAIGAIKSENAALVKQCEERKSARFPVFDAIRDLIQDPFYDYFEKQNNCNKNKTTALYRILSYESKVTEDRFELIPDAKSIALFSEMLENDPQVVKDLEAYISVTDDDNDDLGLDAYPELTKKVGEKINTLLLGIISEEKVREECKDLPLDKSFLITDVNRTAQEFLLRIKLNKQDPCEDLLKPIMLDDLLDPKAKSCLAIPDSELILGALKPLIEINNNINDNLLSDLLNPKSQNANQMVNAIMPGCLQPSNLIPLANVNCETFAFCDPNGEFNDHSPYTGPVKGCYSFAKAKSIMRTKTLNGINNGRALGIAVCPSFLDDPTIKSSFCRKGLPAGDENSLHEMSVTGYRCVADKIEYEIVNSWGDSCEDNSNIKCQVDEDDQSTGPFWVKEDALVDNTTDLTTVRLNPK